MAQQKLLLDTNAYLRLARSIHPLLFVEFGEDRSCLYLAEDFEREFARSRRLRSKFPWVDEPEYRDSRQIRLCRLARTRWIERQCADRTRRRGA